MSKILICTGIYPPQVGGPAQYAKEIADEFRRQGNEVKVLTYVFERALPPLVRHLLFFCRTLWVLFSHGADFIFILDTFSVGWPAVAAAKLTRHKAIIRTGGDFLWESYVERSGDLVLLKDFYGNIRKNPSMLSFKERMIFAITKWTLQNARAVIFSTEWQQHIFEGAYELDWRKSFVVENFYGSKLPVTQKNNRTFVASSRNLRLKNVERLKKAFAEAREIDQTIELNTSPIPYDDFLEEISKSYAVILVSVSDISPNMILDAVRTNTPFIVTKHTGLHDKLKDIGIFVDPENTADIRDAVHFLSDVGNYEAQRQKIISFTFTHSWGEICNEILLLSKKIS